MKHPTSSKGPAAHSATWLLRLGHASLISLGLVALVYIADSRLEATPSTSFDVLARPEWGSIRSKQSNRY